MPEENQNQQNITLLTSDEVAGRQAEENPVSAEPKQETIEPVPAVDNPTDSQNIADQTLINAEIKDVVENAGLPRSEELAETMIEEVVEETGSLHSVREDEIVEEVPQIETPPITQTQEVEQPQQTKTVEKIIYQTPPNLIQNLLNKARVKIQERKRNKLDKIMFLFESNPNISNSNVQELLRTTKRSATRYLNILEKEQKIIQVGNAGRGAKYIKKP